MIFTDIISGSEPIDYDFNRLGKTVFSTKLSKLVVVDAVEFGFPI